MIDLRFLGVHSVMLLVLIHWAEETSWMRGETFSWQTQGSPVAFRKAPLGWFYSEGSSTGTCFSLAERERA